METVPIMVGLKLNPSLSMLHLLFCLPDVLRVRVLGYEFLSSRRLYCSRGGKVRQVMMNAQPGISLHIIFIKDLSSIFLAGGSIGLY